MHAVDVSSEHGRGYCVVKRVRRHGVLVTVLVVSVLLLLCGCDTAVPDRRVDVDHLSEQLGSLPGVQAVTTDYANNWAQGRVLFTIHARVASDLTADHMAAIVDAYLHNLKSARYRSYHTELDIRRGWNVFTVASSDQPIANATQILDQARGWVALRAMLSGAKVALRATVSHPSAHLSPREIEGSNAADVELPDGAHSVDVASAVGSIAAHFPHLAVLSWTVSAAWEQNQIAFTRRFPTAAELDLWRELTGDQSIAHTDSMRINGPVTPALWLSEATTGTDAVDVALALAARHLPLAARLPAPVLYTASDQLSGHIGGHGVARGPVAVTIGGCTPRDPLVYRPGVSERALIRRYEACH